MRTIPIAIILAATLSATTGRLAAGTVTFAEYDGMPNNSQIPVDSPPAGLPDGITATWTGFLLHTRAGDTPMSIFPSADVPGGDDAYITFSAPVIVSSINVFDTTWGSPFSIIGRLGGTEVWRYVSKPQDEMTWVKVTVGAGRQIDTLVFEGRWNHIDDIVVEQSVGDTDFDGIPDDWEYGYFPGDLTQLGAGDYDGDMLDDLTEYQRGTDPTSTDTDGDGLGDAAENLTGLFLDEFETGTSPILPDTDGDGLNDGDEVFTTHTDPNLADTDNDGLNDGTEVANGTDPLVPEIISWFRIVDDPIIPRGRNVKLEWRVAPGALASIEPDVGDLMPYTDVNGAGQVEIPLDATKTYTLISSVGAEVKEATVMPIALPTGVGLITFRDRAGLVPAEGQLEANYSTGVPLGLDITWMGFNYKEGQQGDPPSPAFVYVRSDVDGSDDATMNFSTPAILARFDAMDTAWGSPVHIEGRLNGQVVWSWDSPGDGEYIVTAGAGIEVDQVAFEGRWNHYNNMVIELPGVPTHPELRLTDLTVRDGHFEMSWDSLPEWTYEVFKKHTVDDPWTLLEIVPSAGSTTTFTDPEPAADQGYYRVLRLP